MNVAEPIAQLQKFQVQLPVLVEGYESGRDGIPELSTVGVVRYRKAHEWNGE